MKDKHWLIAALTVFTLGVMPGVRYAHCRADEPAA